MENPSDVPVTTIAYCTHTVQAMHDQSSLFLDAFMRAGGRDWFSMKFKLGLDFPNVYMTQIIKYD